MISIPIFYGLKVKKWVFYICGAIGFTILNLAIPILGRNFQVFLRSIIPEGLWINFTPSGYETLNISRVGIWTKAIEFIHQLKEKYQRMILKDLWEEVFKFYINTS